MLQRAAAPSLLLLLRRVDTAPCSLCTCARGSASGLAQASAWDYSAQFASSTTTRECQAVAAAAFEASKSECSAGGCRLQNCKSGRPPVQAPAGKRFRALFTRGRAAWRWRSTRARACKKHFGPASAGIAPAAARRLGQPHSHRQQRSHERAAPQAGGHADRCACWAKKR